MQKNALTDAMPSENMYALRRIDRCKSGYWAVALMRNRQLFARRFSDLQYGGKEAAFQAALAYRNQTLLDNPPQSKLAVRQQKRKGATGMAGVYRMAKKTRKGERVYYWEAKTRMPNGRYCSRSFSILRYGEEHARQLAEQERRRQLAETEDIPYLLTAEARQVHEALFSAVP